MGARFVCYEGHSSDFELILVMTAGKDESEKTLLWLQIN